MNKEQFISNLMILGFKLNKAYSDRTWYDLDTSHYSIYVRVLTEGIDIRIRENGYIRVIRNEMPTFQKAVNKIDEIIKAYNDA